MKQNNRTLGSEGEMIAARYLTNQGYRVIRQNYRCKVGEVDLIAEDGGYLVFIEVKLRQSSQFGLPREAVHRRKQQQIIKVASWYLSTFKITDKFIRFDVVEVYGKSNENIKLLKNAFWC